MTPYHKYLCVWGLAFLALVVLGASVRSSVYFVPLLVLVASASAVMIHSITCPQCGTSIGYGGRFKGVPMARSFLDTCCNECGCDLNPR